MSADTTAPPATRAGKYLSLFLGDEEYGIGILEVREIIGLLPITPVPRSPEHVLGVINLRGKVIPVIELRRKFNMPSVDETEETCIIVLQAKEELVGVVVDRVSEVREIPEEEIVDAPVMGDGLDTSYILGIGKSDDHVTILLDFNRILTDEDVEHAEATPAGA